MKVRDELNQKKFLASLKDIYTRLKVSQHGIGVFAIRDIPANKNPFKQNYMGKFIPVDPLYVIGLEKGLKELVIDFCPLQDGYYYVPEHGMGVVDVSFYLNHSNTPNMRVDKHGLDFYTIRDIKDGEELTVDYNTYDEQVEEFKITPTKNE